LTGGGVRAALRKTAADSARQPSRPGFVITGSTLHDYWPDIRQRQRMAANSGG